MKRTRLSRRSVLRGMGVSLALPVLDAMLDERGLLHGSARAQGRAHPTRLFVWAFGNGTRMNLWNPSSSEGALTLSPALEPLAQGSSDVHRELTVITGLDHKQTVQSGAHDGVFIANGGPNVKSSLSAFPLPGGPSIDTVAAGHLASATKLHQLAVSNDKEELINWCILSWTRNGSPIEPYRSPRALFDKLLGDGGSGPSPEQVRARALRKSVLDFVAGEAARLTQVLGALDRAKVEEHLTAVRQVERQLEHEVHTCGAPETDLYEGADFVRQGRVLMDLTVLALKCDLVRHGTFNYQNSDGNQVWPGMSWRDHSASHDADDSVILEITRRKMVEFRYFLEQLKAIPEGDGTLLDHSLILCSSEIGWGNSHSTRDLPVIIAGRGGGFRPGRLLKRPGENYNNMLCSLLNYAGVPMERFGVEGTGPIAGL